MQPQESDDDLAAHLPDAATRAAMVAALGRFAVVDLETTGLDAEASEVIEAGAVLLAPDAPPVLFQRLVRPGVPVPAITQTLTGLSDEDLEAAPSWAEVSAELTALLSGATVVAHNAAFERAYLGHLLPPGTPFLDTLELACVLRPELPGHSLETLARELLGRVARHRALEDALDTLAVLALLFREVRAGAHRALEGALGEVREAWPWGRLWGEGGVPGERLGALGEASVVASRPVVTAAEPPRRATIPPEWYSIKFVTELLADEARWRRHVPGYRAREAQIELARALFVALAEDRAVAAEAGTGIGKTLAYTLVGLLHALHSKERVVVSSANRTLQERVIEEELPRITKVLGLPPQPAVVLKGRANYGCPARALALAARPDAFGFPTLEAGPRLYLASYFARCPERDLQSFGGWLLAQDPRLRGLPEALACSADCDERACRALATGPCAYLRRVDALADATIVSVNHSLLLTWPARYGPIDRLIIDEAHELAQEGDRVFREEVSARGLRQALQQMAAGGRGGILAALGSVADEMVAARRAIDLARRCELALEVVGRLLLPLCGQGETSVPRRSAAGVEPRWADAAGALDELASSLAALADDIARVAGAYRAVAGRDDALSSRATAVATTLAAAGRGLLADAFEQTREATVYAAWAHPKRDGVDWGIRATPLEVAELIYTKLLEPARTVIAVSATLGIGGNPGPTLEKIGWHLLPAERRLPEMVLPSPFDYPRRSVLALAEAGTYRARGFADDCAQAIATIARLLGGRTLALFTSRNRLAEVAQRLEPLLASERIAVLVQRRSGGAARLVEQFAASPRAVLLGTRSLWQGVDVPGDALSCVVVDKLPFPAPDPLQQGRGRLVREAGGDEFRAVSLEPAVVSFKQMFGRLIRSESDRGFVVVLGADPAKPYIQDFVRSLPGPPRLLVGGMAEILADMRRFFA